MSNLARVRAIVSRWDHPDEVDGMTTHEAMEAIRSITGPYLLTTRVEPTDEIPVSVTTAADAGYPTTEEQA